MFIDIFIIVTGILELLLISAAAILNYLTKVKMGPARYIVHLNQKYGKRYDLELYKKVSFIGVLIISIISLLYFFTMIHSYVSIGLLQAAVLVLFIFYYIYFVLKKSIKILKAYYVMYLAYSISLILTSVNMFLVVNIKFIK
jgi:hypothetical protein